MPREETRNKAPITLKRVLMATNEPYSTFAEEFTKETGIHLSRTSCKYMLDYGQSLKRVKDFKETVAQFATKRYGETIKQMGLTKNDLWNTEEEKIGDINAMKLEKFTEATMITKETMKHFGLKSAPFTHDIRKESDIYLSESHAVAYEVMREAAEYGGFAVVTGQVGSGKSTVLSKFLEENRITQKYQTIFPEAIDKTKLGAKGILQSCVYDLSDTPPKAGMEALSRQVKNLLTKKSANLERTVLIIEEAHDLSSNTLKYLKRLWEMKNGLQRLMGIILVGQNELESRLYGKANTEIREVTTRTTHVSVEPIAKELPDYIAHKIRAAGGEPAKIMEVEAVLELAKRMTIIDRNGKKQSVAYPLTVNNIMNRLMNDACLQGEEFITKEFVINTGI